MVVVVDSVVMVDHWLTLQRVEVDLSRQLSLVDRLGRSTSIEC